MSSGGESADVRVAISSSGATLAPKFKALTVLDTPKYHRLGDHARVVLETGTTDSKSTRIQEGDALPFANVLTERNSNIVVQSNFTRGRTRTSHPGYRSPWWSVGLTRNCECVARRRHGRAWDTVFSFDFKMRSHSLPLSPINTAFRARHDIQSPSTPSSMRMKGMLPARYNSLSSFLFTSILTIDW